MKEYRLVLLASFAAAGCSGKFDPGASTLDSVVVGQHSTDGTYAVNSTHDPSGAPAGMYAPHREQQTLSVTSLGNSTYEILEVEGGESYTVQLKGGVLSAEGARVRIDPNGSASTSYGRVERTITSFRWDVASGDLQYTSSAVTNLPGGGQSFGFDDVRIVGVKDSTRHWVHYQADTNFPSDFQHGAACVLGGKDTAEGNLGLALGANRNELAVYVQGIGCTFTATSSDGSIYSASGADCPLDPVMSVAALGILNWTFESFSLDVGAKHVSFVARATRKRDDDQIVDLCLKLDSDLTGNLSF